MAQPNIIQDGIDRFETTFRSLEKDWKRLQKRADQRRKQLEKRAEKQVKRLQTQLRKNPVVKRAETLRDDTQKALETSVDTLLDTLRIANTSHVAKLERKVNALNRKVRELERDQAA